MNTSTFQSAHTTNGKMVFFGSVVSASLFLVLGTSVLAEDWLNWRGNDMLGTANGDGYAVRWSSDENIAWRVELPGPGNSSPIIVGDSVYITCASEDGRLRHLISFDRSSGDERWRRSVEFDQAEQTHRTNPQCSPSPCSDGDKIVVWHGSAGLLCYSPNGDVLWTQDVGVFEHIWGVGASPIIVDQQVILSAGPGLSTFLASFDLETGEPGWRREFEGATSRTVEEYRGSWVTPVVADTGDGDVLLLNLPGQLHALDPTTGEDVWTCQGLSLLAYATPVYDDRHVISMCGYGGPAMAVRRGGKGDVTDTHRVWLTSDRNPQRVGSGYLSDGHFYVYNETGVVWCIEVETGTVKWMERVGAKSWSSFVHADGLLYISDMDGVTHVLRVSPEGCEIISQNPIGELVRASLGFSNGQIFLRGYETLMCIEP